MHHPRRRRLRRRLLPALSLLVLLSACGGEPTPSASGDAPEEPTAEADDEAAASDTDDPSDTGAQESDDGDIEAAGDGFPVTLESGDATVEITSRPERIVSLSPTATEMLFAVGAGDQVVAVDDQSDYPEDVPTTDLSGFEPNVEAIADHDPDLVIASSDPGDLVASLETIDIPVLLHPSATTLDDAYAQIEQTGAATGNAAQAAEVVARMRDDIDAILEDLDPPEEPLTYYHELDPTYYSVASSTFIGEVYGLLGLQSIADEAEEFNGGYPQLSPEFILEADPDLIFLADAECCDVTADEVAGRPGWDTLTAVEHDAIVELDEDVASRWGPRIVEFVRTVADAVTALEPAA